MVNEQEPLRMGTKSESHNMSHNGLDNVDYDCLMPIRDKSDTIQKPDKLCCNGDSDDTGGRNFVKTAPSPSRQIFLRVVVKAVITGNVM
jgi:hypothetical protein